MKNTSVVNEQVAMDILKKNSPAKYYLCKSLDSLIKRESVGPLGKILAEANEFIQADWINKNTKIKVVKREELDDSKLNFDKNASGFDLITTDGKMKIQSKLRFSVLHLEQTRRVSDKNKNSSGSGHVQYSVGESDVYLFSRPACVKDYDEPDKWAYFAIPETALIDPNNSNYLRRTVPKKIWKQYLDKAPEILESVYNNLRQ
jgi:hypothetical protein